jgi:hypothetical protein
VDKKFGFSKSYLVEKCLIFEIEFLIFFSRVCEHVPYFYRRQKKYRKAEQCSQILNGPERTFEINKKIGEKVLHVGNNVL